MLSTFTLTPGHWDKGQCRLPRHWTSSCLLLRLLLHVALSTGPSATTPRRPDPAAGTAASPGCLEYWILYRLMVWESDIPCSWVRSTPEWRSMTRREQQGWAAPRWPWAQCPLPCSRDQSHITCGDNKDKERSQDEGESLGRGEGKMLCLSVLVFVFLPSNTQIINLMHK